MKLLALATLLIVLYVFLVALAAGAFYLSGFLQRRLNSKKCSEVVEKLDKRDWLKSRIKLNGVKK